MPLTIAHRGARLLLAVALSAVLLVPAPGAATASRHRSLSPYAGLGTWLDIYATSYWVSPRREVAAMARAGVRTLYLQTGNYQQRVALVRPRALGRFVDAAHAAGLRIVAWYLPGFTNPRQDERRALAAIRFRSPHGERFDSFSLDIEADLVSPASLRTRRLLRLSTRLRKAVGPRYSLGAITPGPVGLRRHPDYWPGFPFRSLARFYDVFLPMAYSTDAGVHGVTATRSYLAADIAGIRARTGGRVPIHLIGGLAGTMGARETRGFVQAVAGCRPLGYSLYAFSITRPATWPALTARRPRGSTRGCR